jgi:hypothetical protein
MPTNRKRRKHHLLAPASIPIGLWRWLIDEPHDPEQSDGILQRFTSSDEEVWNTYRDKVLAYWVREHPGTRPENYWRFEIGPPASAKEAAEEQVDYLRRHRLLTAHERKVLKVR